MKKQIITHASVGFMSFVVLLGGVVPVSGYTSRHYGTLVRSRLFTPAVITAVPTTTTTASPLTFRYVMDLSYGMENSEVRLLQSRLFLEKYFPFPISTGYFGPATYAAVVIYQRERGIPATGYVGIETRAALNRGFGTGSTTSK